MFRKIKKPFAISSILVMFLFLLLPFGSAFAYTGGLLDGKTLNFGVDMNTIPTTTTLVTDNNLDTTVELGPSGEDKAKLWYEFETEQTIDGFKINVVGSEYLYLRFFDSSGSEIYNESVSETNEVDGTLNSITPVSNVKKVVLLSADGAYSHTVSELNVYNSVESDITPPGNVGSLVATGLDESAKLTWNNPSDTDLNKIFIEDANGVEVYSDIIAPFESSTTITGLTNDQSYTFTVYTQDKDGNTSTGTSVNVTPTISDSVAPAEVSNIVTDIKQTTVDFTFDNPLDSDFSHVNIYKDGVLHGTTTFGNYSVTGLTADTSYSFKFTTVDDNGNESVGTVKSITTLVEADTVAPNVPTGLTVTEGNSYLNVDWETNLESDVKGYNIYVNGVKHNVSPIAATSYTINGLTNDDSYSITVPAIDTSGNESAQTLAEVGVPSSDAVPLLSLGYDLKDVATSVGNWFAEMWLIVAFATAIPLAFYISNRTKLLFLD